MLPWYHNCISIAASSGALEKSMRLSSRFTSGSRPFVLLVKTTVSRQCGTLTVGSLASPKVSIERLDADANAEVVVAPGCYYASTSFLFVVGLTYGDSHLVVVRCDWKR